MAPGKSTTIRLLMGALRPDSGTCTVLGADSAAPEFLSLKEDIGVVLDEAYFPESLNALQVGGVMAKTYRRWDGKQYQNYLTRFGLPEKKPFKDFSRGMKMKLAIAVALSHSPSCWCWTRPLPAWTPSSGTRCWRSSTSSPGRRTTPS